MEQERSHAVDGTEPFKKKVWALPTVEVPPKK